MATIAARYSHATIALHPLDEVDPGPPTLYRVQVEISEETVLQRVQITMMLADLDAISASIDEILTVATGYASVENIDGDTLVVLECDPSADSHHIGVWLGGPAEVQIGYRIAVSPEGLRRFASELQAERLVLGDQIAREV